MSSPADFDSPFLGARAVRHGRYPLQRRSQLPPDASGLIPWREFVQAIFQLPPGWDYHGDLPEGMSAQQFWSRVYRAAQGGTRNERKSPRKDAKVGILIRGGRFWVWPEKIPPQEEKLPTKARRGWVGQLMLQLRSGEPVELDHELSNPEKQRLRERALRRGWRLHIAKVKNGVSRVQWVGEAR